MTRLTQFFRKFNSIFLNLLGRAATESSFACDMLTISKRNNHLLFEWMLRRYDPSLDLTYCRSATGKAFINKGSGSGTIKPYRSFNKGNVRYFEKIFFGDAPELKSISDFYGRRSELACPHQIQCPSLLGIIKGNKLTVVLYEYRMLETIADGREYEALKTGALAIAQNLPIIQTAAPIRLNLILDGEKYLLTNGIFTPEEIHKIKEITGGLPVYFQHLDLSTKNVFADNMIMDWDHSGHYPLGPDMGMLLFHYFYFYQKDFLSSYKEEIKSYHRKYGQEIDLISFTTVVLYYCTVYYKGYFRDYEDAHIFPEVVRQCKALLLLQVLDTAEMVCFPEAGLLKVSAPC